MSTRAPAARARWHDAYDAQMALWRWYRTPQGRGWLEYSYQNNVAALNPDTREMLGDLFSAELGRLIDLDPIFVSSEMCELIDAAKDTFAPEPLVETDLVTTRGFLLYERPFLVPDRFEEPVTIHAVSWARTLAAEDETKARVIREAIAAGFSDTFDARRFEQQAIDEGARPTGIALTLYATAPDRTPPLAVPVIPFHVTPWWFGMTFDGNEWDENNEPTGTEWWWRIVQTTFRLMQQHVAVRHVLRPDRSTRREAARLRFPDDREVVVVRLRREQSERHDESPHADANYSHRFIVSGHWRNQWYPSINAHRQIWISPFVKGPEGLPLIVRPRRVFQWER